MPRTARAETFTYHRVPPPPNTRPTAPIASARSSAAAHLDYAHAVFCAVYGTFASEASRRSETKSDEATTVAATDNSATDKTANNCVSTSAINRGGTTRDETRTTRGDSTVKTTATEVSGSTMSQEVITVGRARPCLTAHGRRSARRVNIPVNLINVRQLFSMQWVHYNRSRERQCHFLRRAGLNTQLRLSLFARGDGDVCAEDMEPPGDVTYRSGPRDGSVTLHTSLNGQVASVETMAKYNSAIVNLPPTETRPGVSGTGLFVKRRVGARKPIIEYTGNRVSGSELFRMEQALDLYGKDPEGFVLVNDDKQFIDPRGVGNDAQFVNHSCEPNAELREIRLGDRVIVVIVALRAIKAGEEVLVDYGYESHRTMKPIFCDCGSKRCRIFI